MKNKLLTALILAGAAFSGFGTEGKLFSLKDTVLSGQVQRLKSGVYSLDGKTGELSLRREVLNHPESGITLLAIVKVLNCPGNTPADRQHDAVFFRNKQFVFGIDFDRFYVNFHNGQKWFAPILVKSPVADRQFHSFAMTAKRIKVPSQGEDYLQVHLYIDGELAASENFQRAEVNKSDSPLNIGYADGFGDVWHFGGEIADIAAFNRVLDLNEIQDHTAAFPELIRKQPQKIRRLSAADQKLLDSLLVKNASPEWMAAHSALRNLAYRIQKFDWRKSAELLRKKGIKALTDAGLTQYRMKEALLTVAADSCYATPISLYDLRAGRELLCWNNPFFRLKFSGKTVSPVSDIFESRFIAVDHSRFQIRWTSPDVIASAEFTCLPDGLDYTVRAELRKKGLRLEQIEYPALELAALKSDASLFAPVMSGVAHKNAVHRNISYDLEYPRGIASMQYGAFYDNAGGLFWSPADPLARMKMLHFQAGGERVRIRYDWFPAENEPFDPKSPVRLKLFRGSWYEAAMLYRQMLKEIQALWVPHDPLPRRDSPAWIRENTLWFLHGGSRLDSMAPFKAVREYLGLPFAVHLYRWNSKVFDRDYPHHQALPSFLNILEECHSMGIRVTPYTNGRLWETLDRREEDYLYSSLGKANCVADAKGKLVMSVFNKRNFAIICPFTAVYEKMMRKSCFMLEAMGADGIYIDQIGAAMHIPCYDRKHGHRIPDDRAWFEKGHHKVFSRIREEMHRRNPETVLTTEDNAETCVRNFDGLLCWRWMYMDQVPAFSAVYSGRTQLIGLTYNLKRDAEASFAKAAWQILGGGQLGWFSRDYFCHPGKHDFRVWIKQLMHLRLAMLPFFNEGKMARPLEYAAPIPEKVLFWGDHGTLRVNTPAISSSVWTFNGIYAAMIFNPSASEQKNKVKLTPPFRKGILYQFSSANKESSSTCTEKTEYAFMLPPHSFLLLLAVPEEMNPGWILRNIRGQFVEIISAPHHRDPFVRDNSQPMSSCDLRSRMTLIRADKYRCQMFPGCIYPVRFTLPDGTPLPELTWNDRITFNGTIYRLDCDRWAKQRILCNTPEELEIECTGTFCTNDREVAIPGKVQARYRYTFRRDSPEVRIAAAVVLPSDMPAVPELLKITSSASNQRFILDLGPQKKNGNTYIRTGKIIIR